MGSRPYHWPPSPKMSAKPEHKTSPQFQRFPHAHSYVILMTAPFPSEKTKTLNHSSEFLPLPSAWLPGFNQISCLSNTSPVSSLHLTPQTTHAAGRSFLLVGCSEGFENHPTSSGEEPPARGIRDAGERGRQVLSGQAEPGPGQASECLRGS